jgi:2-iminobutanoate/2-iminopropanoate deaminase
VRTIPGSGFPRQYKFIASDPCRYSTTSNQSEGTMKKIETHEAPAAIGPYSQAIAKDGLLFVSGQIPLDPTTGEVVGSTAAEQVEQSLKNLSAIAMAAGTSLGKTVKTTVLLTDLSEFAAVNKVYSQYFVEPYPARACYQVVALPKAVRVEVEAVISLD